MTNVNLAIPSQDENRACLPSWQERSKRVVGEFAPGVLLSITMAMAAMFVHEHYGGPAMLYALLFGMAFNFLRTDERFTPGTTFAAKQILRIGVALLGVRITLGDVSALGVPVALMIGAGVFLTITIGTAVGRMLGLKNDQAILSAVAVAICGASAALAISAVLPRHENSERNTIMAVIGVTTLSTFAMILYPICASWLGLSDQEAGVFIGATIHDVAQVVGAGYMISDESGETATIVKLMRVSCLVPVVFVVGLMFRAQNGSTRKSRPPLFPLFLVGFVFLVVANSVGLIPGAMVTTASDLSRYALITAVAALGMKTSLPEIVRVGVRPVLLLTIQTALLALFVLGVLTFVFQSMQ